MVGLIVAAGGEVTMDWTKLYSWPHHGFCTLSWLCPCVLAWSFHVPGLILTGGVGRVVYPLPRLLCNHKHIVAGGMLQGLRHDYVRKWFAV